MSIDYKYSHLNPAAERERPDKQLYKQDGVILSVIAAQRMFTHSFTTLPVLSICLIGLDFQWFSPLCCGSSLPLFHGALPLLAIAAFLCVAISLSYVIGFRWFSDMVHHLKLSARLFERTVSIWSTTAPSKYSPHISGKAKATNRCTEIVTPFPPLYKETRTYPVFGFGLGGTLIPPCTIFNPPFGCLTSLSSERTLPRFDISYSPSYPLIDFQISIPKLFLQR